MPENEKSDSEDYMYAKFSCRVLFEGGFSRYITEDMVKKTGDCSAYSTSNDTRRTSVFLL